jgi:isocitrate/isopropylmalate dehydrogenase
MMLDWIGNNNNDSVATEAGKKIESALYSCLRDGLKTPDLGGKLSSQEFTFELIKRINNPYYAI